MTKSQSWNDTWGKICCGETKKEELITLIDKLLANKTSVNLTDEEGKTPLMHIISLGLTESVKKVIEMGADVNAKDHTGITALMIASDYGDTEVVEHLISCNADVNAKDKDGWTAMIFACINGHAKIVQILENAIRNSSYCLCKKHQKHCRFAKTLQELRNKEKEHS